MSYSYSIFDLLCFFLIFSFLGWLLVVLTTAVLERKIINCGFVGLPFFPSCGFVMLILMMIYPSMTDDIFIFKYIAAVVVSAVVSFLAGSLSRQLSGYALWNYQEINLFAGELKPFARGLLLGLLYMTGAMLVVPLLDLAIPLIPKLVKAVVSLALTVLLLLDLLLILLSLRKNGKSEDEVAALLGNEKKLTYNLGQSISSVIWKRLDKAYPNWKQTPEEKLPVFASGFCFYKMVWVFLISSLAGDLFETVFMRIAYGSWTSRSSLVYGPFSVVWGFGAVLLTVLLHRLAQRNLFLVFLGGSVIGGVYEYSCSVFTEVFLGASFWNYSKWPGNIGGRTNVLFCLFWGVLALFWVKVCYPPLSRAVEKIPTIAGTVLTWFLVLALILDTGLTVGIMWRYGDRKNGQEPKNIVEELLDENYPDSFVKHRWRNLKLP